MRRRDFITLLGGGAVTWPLAARAQQPERIRRIGVVAGNIATDPEEQIRSTTFRQRLAELGWVEGRSVWFDYRWAATDEDRIRSHVAEYRHARLWIAAAQTDRWPYSVASAKVS